MGAGVLRRTVAAAGMVEGGRLRADEREEEGWGQEL